MPDPNPQSPSHCSARRLAMDRLTAAVLIALCFVNPVRAEQPQQPAAPPPTHIRASVEKIRFDVPRTDRNMTLQQSAGGNRTARKIAMGIEFGLLGAVLGASIGESVTKHCTCDD